MVTNVFIANALATVAADVDGSFVTQDNAIFATGSSTGSAIFNLGTMQTVIEAFTGAGSIAYDTANNHFYAADGSFLTFSQLGATVALVAQGTVGGTLDLNGAGLSFTPDVDDGALGLAVTKDGSTFNLALNGTGTVTFGNNCIITIPKDFSLNLAATSYNGVPLAGNIHGDGVNDVYATLVNGTQLLLTSNGTVGANLNLAGVALNNVTLSGSIVLDPLNKTLTFTQGSSLGVDMGTRHINFTTTDSAGGQLTLGTDGLTFKTAGGDGGLILSVTENGVTRQTALNVVGEITYSTSRGGLITLGAGTTVTNSWASGTTLAITSNTGGGAVVHLTDDGLKITTTDPEAVTATIVNETNYPLSNIKLTGTATYDSGGIILSEGSTLTAINETESIPLTVTALGSDTTLHFGTATNYISVATAGQCILILDEQVNILSHGSHTSTPFRVIQISAGTDLIASKASAIVMSDVGVYAVNGTFITNNVAGSTLVSNTDGSIVYNGTTYAAGEFAVDAAGNGIGVAISADLAGDFLPNYDTDFANALQLTDAGAFDTQLTDLLPSDTARLGEISFDTETDKLNKPQLVIAARTGN